jgi:hypothetical protein
LFRTPQAEINELSELILRDTDAKQRFNAALHDKELPHTIYSIGESRRPDQSPEENLRQKKAWQRVQRLKEKQAAQRR